MPTPHAGARSPVVVVHAAVPGRVRLRVPRAYRDDAVKRRIEEALSTCADVTRVEVSTLTATALVVGAADLAPDDLRRRIARLLDLPFTDAPTPPRARTLAARVGRIARAAARLRGDWAGAARVVVRGAPGGEPRDRRGHPRAREEAVVDAAFDLANGAWHARPARDLFAELGTSGEGLAHDEARARLARSGPNALAEAKRRSEVAIFFEQLESWPVALLTGSAALSIATGGFGDAIVIAAVVLLNAAIGYATESHAERVIRSLERSGPTRARVIRDGTPLDVPTEEIVVGDLLVLSPATGVAADARLLASDVLVVDESMLTGESVPVAKSASDVHDPICPLADRRNMVHRGTLVTGGSGIAIVVATGAATEIGRVQLLAGAVKPPETPLQQHLDRLGLQLVIGVGVVCSGVFAVGLARRLPLVEMLKLSVSLAVAAIPEGLPTVAITTLALGVRRMHERDVLVRALPAVETLGAVQTMCFDKPEPSRSTG